MKPESVKAPTFDTVDESGNNVPSSETVTIDKEITITPKVGSETPSSAEPLFETLVLVLDPETPLESERTVNVFGSPEDKEVYLNHF